MGDLLPVRIEAGPEAGLQGAGSRVVEAGPQGEKSRVVEAGPEGVGSRIVAAGPQGVGSRVVESGPQGPKDDASRNATETRWIWSRDRENVEEKSWSSVA